MEGMDMLPQLLVNGLISGSNYAMVAAGYAMVYSILKMMNFAHGYVVMVGAYLAYAFIVWLGLNLVLSFLLSMLISGILGFGIERIGYRPLRKAARLAPLMTAIGISLLLESIAMLIWGADIRAYPRPIEAGYYLLGARITPVQVSIIGAALVFMLSMHWLINKTPLGVAVRATSDDLEMTSMMGIDSNRVISIVFVIGAALAAVSGILVGYEADLQPTIGLVVTIKAFAAVILGGLGSIYGAILGGLLIGFAENLGVWFIPAVWKDAIAYVILLAILLVKPSGLLGERYEAETKL
jgi:branched-chain amino acid transport system permease protein